MYAAKVKILNQDSHEAIQEEVGEPTNKSNTENDSISFSAGNPRVEHITGVVHLFRQVPSRQEANGPPPPPLPEGHDDRVCVLTMPANMGVAEFCSFLGGYLPSVREMRFVRREGKKQQCLVFLQFESIKQAALFFKDFNSKPFSSLEPDVLCHLVFIKALDLVSGDETEAIHPPPGQTELPSCPVCLERLDQHISGVVTTVCNHKFHSECLRQWGDESCPVCRFCLNSSSMTSQCSTCGTSQDLWICLICGHVGCGRYREKHSIDHWKDSGHVYALELETQRVWDYVGDGYVHRLIQSKTDGKLVEVPSPAPNAASSRAPDFCSTQLPLDNLERDSDMQDALFASKVDAFAAEYNHLLVSQLDSQRQYFEAQLRMQDTETQRVIQEAQAATALARSEAQKAQNDAREALQGKKNLERKVAETTAKAAEMRKERDFLKALNETVMRNQADLKEKTQLAEQGCRDAKAKVSDLEDQVRDLMIFIEARQTVAASNGELQDGTLIAAQSPKQRRRGQSHRK